MARCVKRFTETNKWNDPWYRKMSPAAKLLWAYMTDFCNCAGIIDLDEEAAGFHIGQPIKSEHIAELGTRIQQVAAGRYYIRQFIPFQYGELSPNCPAHQPIFKMVAHFGLQKNGMGYDFPVGGISAGAATLPPAPAVPAREKSRQFTPPTREELDLQAGKIGLPAIEVEKFVSHYASKGWKVGGQKMQSWQHALTGWKVRWEEKRTVPAKPSGTFTPPLPPSDPNDPTRGWGTPTNQVKENP